MKNNSISAVLVIYNEEAVLERCLKSIKDVVDEIIIVHDGECTDKSLEIAKKYNCKVYIRGHVGVAEYHRPFAFEKAIGNWILHIDADEFLPEETSSEIPKLIENANVDAYSFRWPLWINNRNEYFTTGPFSKMQRLCLYRKNKMSIVGITTYHPKTTGKILHCKNLLIEHRHPYFKFDFPMYQTKVMSWAKLEASQTINYTCAPLFNVSLGEVSATFSPKIKNPLFFGIKDVIHQLLHYVKNGLFVSDFLTWKVAALDLYRISVTYYYLYKLGSLKPKALPEQAGESRNKKKLL